MCQSQCNDYRGRAKRHGVSYEPISRLAVFKRDGWKCQICGVKTPRRLIGKTDDRSPELDHRIPMAQGGGHLWENVQCACRRCNAEKGAHTIVGQLHLFPKAA